MAELARALVPEPPAMLRPSRAAAASRDQGDRSDAPPPRARSPLGNLAVQTVLRAMQAKLSVGAPDDRYEHEAERTAHQVMSTSEAPAPARAPAAAVTPLVQRAPAPHHAVILDDEDKKKTKNVQLRADTASARGVPAGIAASIASMMSGGDTLPGGPRSFFESRFGYDFGDVRVHADAGAAAASSVLGAQAFTVGNHIFFGSGHYAPESPSGRHLIAHELTHTIQQETDRSRVATRLQRAPLPISSAPRGVQRGWFSDALDAILDDLRDLARAVPGYELLSFVLGRDPITDKPVERSAENLIKAVLSMFPGGDQIYARMAESKKFQEAMAWFHEQTAKLNLTWEGIKQVFSDALDSLTLSDLWHPVRAWDKIVSFFGPPLRRIANFASAVFGKIVDWVKAYALGKLREWAMERSGYELFTFILGKDPFTGEPVPRTAVTFVRAVLKLVPGGDEMFANLQKSHTIEKAVAWFDGEVAKLDLSWPKIKALFSQAWDLLTPSQLIHPLDLLGKLGDIFLPPIGRILTFVGNVGKKILEFIFEGVILLGGPMAQRVLSMVRKAAAAIGKIIAHPIDFLGHLIGAVKKGVGQFSDNALKHLEAGLIEWLTGGLAKAAITLPEKLDVKGIFSLVLQILGITYAAVRERLVRLLGERRVAALERVFDFLVLVVTQGISAAWQKLLEMAGNFTDMIKESIKSWIVTSIVKAAVIKLVSLFNPVGALIEAIKTIYNTIVFFVEKIDQILKLVEAIGESILNIAEGNVAAAANSIELAMARAIAPILAFLARFLGLGDVSAAIIGLIKPVQEKIATALDKVADWIKAQAERLLGRDQAEAAPGAPAAAEGAAAGGPAHGKVELSMLGTPHELSFAIEGDRPVITFASSETPERVSSLVEKAVQASEKIPNDDKEKPAILLQLQFLNGLLTDEAIIRAYNDYVKQNRLDVEAKFIHDITASRVGSAFLELYLQGIKGHLVQMATLAHADDLRKVFFGAPIPDKRYLPVALRGQQIRLKFYYTLISGGWDALREGIMRKGRADLGVLIDPIRNDFRRTGDANAAGAALQKLRQAQLVDRNVPVSWVLSLPLYENRSKGFDDKTPLFAVDHDPSVAKHWSELGGHKSDDDDRQAAAEGKHGNPLTMITYLWNSEKGSVDDEDVRHTYYGYVDKPFKSRFAKNRLGLANTLDAASAHDLPFLDERGDPLTAGRT
jgi:hypothetical protein